MSLTDELSKLAALRQSGALTETEFQQAKAKLLSAPPADTSSDTFDAFRRLESPRDNSLGEAANRYVSFKMIMTVISLLIFLFFFAPMMCHQSNGFGGSTIQLR
jgi:hypothetical protein